ncbi:hypothetical protein MIR68_001722 [Amoeboaphelidium protococcarum]|nr:hypothetical protein MIR68_001722 [Amoeboaphelidium protococcarum]
MAFRIRKLYPGLPRCMQCLADILASLLVGFPGLNHVEFFQIVHKAPMITTGHGSSWVVSFDYGDRTRSRSVWSLAPSTFVVAAQVFQTESRFFEEQRNNNGCLIGRYVEGDDGNQDAFPELLSFRCNRAADNVQNLENLENVAISAYGNLDLDENDFKYTLKAGDEYMLDGHRLRRIQRCHVHDWESDIRIKKLHEYQYMWIESSMIPLQAKLANVANSLGLMISDLFDRIIRDEVNYTLLVQNCGAIAYECLTESDGGLWIRFLSFLNPCTLFGLVRLAIFPILFPFWTILLVWGTMYGLRFGFFLPNEWSATMCYKSYEQFKAEVALE